MIKIQQNIPSTHPERAAIMTTTLPTQTTYHQAVLGGRVVRRTVIDSGTAMWFEISVLRTHRQVNPTFQGEIQMVDGQWIAKDADGKTVVGTFGDYADAEAFLVKRRTGVTSSMKWTGVRPDPDAGKPMCRECGNLLNAGGFCRRTDLHWTTASLAADEARRAARREARAAAAWAV